MVFGTLHTNNAAKTVDRIIDVFPQEQQAQIRVMLSESLKAVVAQGLLPTADGKGRCAILEILINTHAVGNLIREGKTFQIPSVMQTSSGRGMITFENHAKELIRQGKITQEIANDFLGKKEEKPEALSKPDPLKRTPLSVDDKTFSGGLSSLANRLKKGG